MFAQYYALPQLSLRNVIWHQSEAGLEYYGLKDIMLVGGGDIHPNERGHACVLIAKSPGEGGGINGVS